MRKANLSLGQSVRHAALAVALLCIAGTRVLAAPPKPVDPAQLIKQAEQAHVTDRPHFLRLVEQLHRMRADLTPDQQQHLEFLDAIVADQAGRNEAAARIYNRLFRHTTDPLLAARARAALIALNLLERNYVKAYSMANALMQELPKARDPSIRLVAWKTIIRVLISEKRYPQAEQYARKLEAAATGDDDRCIGSVFLAQARIYAGSTLDDAQAGYNRALRLCRAAGMPGFANGLRLDWASLMVDEGHPARAIAYLGRIEPRIRKGGYQPHLASLHVTQAQAYFRIGQYARARRAALDAISASDPKGFGWVLQAAYKVLYRIAQREGHPARALAMYEKYMEQYKATSDDVKSQAMAFQMVRQDVQTNQMRLDELGRQNRILQLQQKLARKSAETSRLYVLLLLFVLVFIGFWAWRIKHSQLRFRKMARQDDLTGVCNRPYFFQQVEKALNRLQKTGTEACFLILDMDHFKRVNDMYGHVSGDVVLKHVVRTCQRELRSTDLFGRLGGEEFGILMPGCTRTQGMETGDRIRRSLGATSVTVREHASVTITASIGLASTEICGYTLKSLLVAADDALYAAKRSGRNKLILHSGRQAATAN